MEDGEGRTRIFVDPELADSHSDLLFSARLRTGEPARIYLLLEHQSTDDPAMPLRVLSYQIRIWERFRKEHPGMQIPPIVTVVISHDPDGWNTPHSLDDMFEPSVLASPALAALLPRFTLTIMDLTHVSDSDLKERSLAAFQKLALWALRDARDPVRLLDSFGTWASTMLQLLNTRAGIDAFAILLRYLFGVVDPVYRADLHAKLREMSPRAERTVMTIADQWLEEGREKGLEQGRKQGRREGRKEGCIATLRSQLIFKFRLRTLDTKVEAKLRSATSREIERYLKRVLVADSLAAVFAE